MQHRHHQQTDEMDIQALKLSDCLIQQFETTIGTETTNHNESEIIEELLHRKPLIELLMHHL